MPLPALAAAGIMTALSTGAEYGLQTGLAKGNSRRALKQQQAYTDMSMKANKEMAMFNSNMQLDSMRRSYEQQKEGMKEANLNPALMYGGNGASGVTTAPAQAPSGGQEHGETAVHASVAMGMQNAMQMSLLDAQRKNIEASTKKTEAETANLPKVGENIAADTTNKGLSAEMQRIQNKIAGDSAENVINTARIVMQQADQELTKQQRENYINESTKQQQIDQVKATLGLSLIEKTVKEAGIALTNEQKAAIAENIKIAWANVAIGQQNADTNEFMANLKGMFPDMSDVVARDLRAALDKMWSKINPTKARPNDYHVTHEKK